MFCTNCGNQIADAAVVCPKCGVPIAGKTATSGSTVPSHMVGAILTTIFCCQIGGIVAIVYAAKVNTKLAQGDIEGAQAASKTANNWIIANICVGLVATVIYFLLGVAGAI